MRTRTRQAGRTGQSARRQGYGVGAVVVALGLCLLGALPEQAATRVVTTLADSGLGSLRQALADAQDGDTITFGVTGTIPLSNGPLVIAQDVLIEGPGAAQLTISGNQTSRVFVVPSGVTATIAAVTIREGRITGATIDDSGGGIRNDGTLTVMHSTSTGNSADRRRRHRQRRHADGHATAPSRATPLASSAAAASRNERHADGHTTAPSRATPPTRRRHQQPRHATVTHSTLTGNSATTGGGINNLGTLTRLTIKNAIVANSASGGDCNVQGGTFTAVGANLDTDGTCPDFYRSRRPSSTSAPWPTTAAPPRPMPCCAGSPAIDAAVDCTDVAGSPGSPTSAAWPARRTATAITRGLRHRRL